MPAHLSLTTQALNKAKATCQRRIVREIYDVLYYNLVLPNGRKVGLKRSGAGVDLTRPAGAGARLSYSHLARDGKGREMQYCNAHKNII